MLEADATDFVNRLDGVFAGAAFHRSRSEVVLFRDQVGVKPMYYRLGGGHLEFASTLLALTADCSTTPTLDPAGVDQYLLRGYPLHGSLIAGVHSVRAGTLLRFRSPGQAPHEHRWFTPTAASSPAAASPISIRSLITTAVESEIPSRWPVVTTLSGGVDSTVIALTLHRAGTDPLGLTVRYDVADPNAAQDECAARRVAAQVGMRHELVSVRESDYRCEVLDRWRFDVPIADPNAIALNRLCRAAGRAGSRVLFAGDGADELFGGYTYHADTAGRSPSALAHAWMNTGMTDATDRQFLFRLTGRRIRRRPRPSLTDPLRTVQRRELTEWLEPNLLVKADRFAMAEGVEVRVPFLRSAVVQAALALPARRKVHRGIGKFALKEAFADLLPPYVLSRRKIGFPAPISIWLRSELGRDLAAQATSAVADAWSVEQEQILWAEHRAGAADWGQQLWRLAVLRAWWRTASTPPGSATSGR